MKITYGIRRGLFVTLVNGRVEEAYRDLAEWLESLTDFEQRYARMVS